MFLCQREQPNIYQVIVFISLRVKDDNKRDRKKLLQVMSLLKGTMNNVLMLEADDTNNLIWFIDVALSVHTNMKCSTGAVFMMGK